MENLSDTKRRGVAAFMVALLSIAYTSLVLDAHYQAKNKLPKATHAQIDCLDAWVKNSQSYYPEERDPTNNSNRYPCDSMLVEARGTIASESEAYWTKFGALGSIVMGIGTVLVAVAALVISMRQSDKALEATHKQLRANLSLDNVKPTITLREQPSITNPESGKSKFFVLGDFMIKNFGSTEAREIVYRTGFAEISYRREFISDANLDGLELKSMRPIAKGEERPLNITELIDSEPASRMLQREIDLAANPKVFKFFGLIEYADTFGETHRTEFCFDLWPNKETGVLTLFRSDEYNQAT